MKNINITRLISLLFLVFIMIGIGKFAYSQEEEDPLTGFKWLYNQRVYPDSVIPQGAFWNAAQQRDSLIAANGYAAPNQTWTFQGPMPYTSSFGMVSGRIRALKFGPNDPTGSTIYAAGVGGGLWKSTDAGQTWDNRSGDLPTLQTMTFDIDPNGVIYIGTGEGSYFGWSGGMGVFKSTNDGTHWEKVWSGINVPTNTTIYKVAINPVNASNIYVAEWTGLFVTYNAGQNWSKVVPNNGTNRICTDVCFSPSGNIVYASGYSPSYWTTWFYGIGLWVSRNGGQFTPIDYNSGFPHASAANYQYGRSSLAVSASSESTVYILTFDYGTDANYVYRSDNAGVNWTIPYRINNIEQPVYNTGANTDFNLILKCSPYNSNIVFAGFQVLKRSSDGGANWDSRTPSHPDNHAIDFCPVQTYSQRMIAGCDGGIYITQNLGDDNWTELNDNLGFAQCWDIGSNTYDKNAIIAGVEDEGIPYKNRTPGATDWTTTNIGDRDGTLTLCSPFRSNHYIGSVGVCYNPMYYSTDGYTFSSSNNYLYDNCSCNSCATSSDWVPVSANHPSQPGVSYNVRFGNQGGYFTPVHVLKTTDYGANWNGSDQQHINFANPYQGVRPNQLAISESDPNTMIMGLGNWSDYWQVTGNLYSRLLKTTDGWQTWSMILQCDGSGVIPNRFLTHVEIDPVNKDEIYITFSGYGSPHVFRSTDGGSNWADISTPGGLPNSPTNDLIIHYTSPTTKEIIVAQDVGVWATDAQNNSWHALSPQLPNSPIVKLDQNRISGTLFCSAFGRGVWQYDFPSPIYVKDNLYITDEAIIDKPIIVCKDGKLILGLSAAKSSMTINFTNNANIVVQEGGTLLANSNIPITLTSSGTWGGIEVDGYSSNCVLYNCTFSNTTTPVVINAGVSAGIQPAPTYGVVLNDCHFTNAPVQVSNRPDVTIKYSDWSMNSSTYTDAIIAVGAANLYLLFNEINYSSQVSGSHAIQLSSCSDATITRSTITNADYPITVSNATTYIRYSDISTNYASSSMSGIYLNGVNNGHLIENDVSGYQTAYYLYYQSSPNLLYNNADGSNSNGNKEAIRCEYSSSPRLHPSVDGNKQLIWDAGLNTLRNDASGSTGLYNFSSSAPDLDYGYNTIVGATNIYGTYPGFAWHVRCNSWENNPPVFSVSGVIMDYAPTNCTPPQAPPQLPPKHGGTKHNGFKQNDGRTGGDDGQNSGLTEEPPQPIIVDYGNGLIDTFNVASSSSDITADNALLGDGNKEIYLGNFENAISKFEGIIQNYKDSSTAVLALNRIFYSYTRKAADTSEYNTLRSYYLGVASGNAHDTALFKTANELSRKCLIKKKDYIGAINEYENFIANSADSSDILSAEISIIEIYAIMMNYGGDTKTSYTGRLGFLKPLNLVDAMHKIREKMHHVQNVSHNGSVPNQFSLSQNYPNPFNPVTKIKYALPNPVKVNIKIYDILGRLVKTLVNDEFKDAGFYEITFDGSNFASGVYFYRIEAGKFVQSKKMVILK
jgi:photosystem II stability/assembly factor-like uncharacterized protein